MGWLLMILNCLGWFFHSRFYGLMFWYGYLCDFLFRNDSERADKEQWLAGVLGCFKINDQK